MSTSGGGAVIDSIDTTTDPSPGSGPKALNRLHLPAPATKQEPPTKGPAPGLDNSAQGAGAPPLACTTRQKGVPLGACLDQGPGFYTCPPWD